LQSNKSYLKHQEHFSEILNFIYQVINPACRDRFEIHVVQQAQRVVAEKENSPKQLLVLARNLLKSYQWLREEVRQYGPKVYQLDPCIAQNPALVDKVEKYHTLWFLANFRKQAQTYLAHGQARRQLLDLIEIIGYFELKYPLFRKKLQSLDTEIFFQIPQLIVLQALKSRNYALCLYLGKNCEARLKDLQQLILDNDLERIEDNLIRGQNSKTARLLQAVSIELSRSQPQLFNEMMEIALLLEI